MSALQTNVVLNNSGRAFSVYDVVNASALATPTIQGNPGSDAAINKTLRHDLESGSLVSSGTGIHADHKV